MSALSLRIIIPVALLLLRGLVGAQDLKLEFDAVPKVRELFSTVGEGLSLEPGHAGHAVSLGAATRLAVKPPEYLTSGFEISLWVRHAVPISALHFQELVYLYHESADGKNRIVLQKRLGTDYILFSMSDGTGQAKGAAFAGNWFALKSPDLDWPALTWHELRIAAGREQGIARLWIDGALVAEARGTQLPQALGEHLWLGSLSGRSGMQGLLDDVIIRPWKKAQ